MNGAAHVDLALDVDHIAAPHAHRCRDARSLAEGVVAQLQHGEAIDLADGVACGLDEDGFAQHLVLHEPGNTVEAENLGVDGLVDMLGADALRAGFVSPVVGLLEQVDDGLKLGGEPLAVADQAGGVIQHRAHGPAIQVAQPVIAHDGGDQACVGVLRVGRALDLVRKVGRHLEKLVEVRVGLREQVVEHAVAEQYDLDVEWHGFRFQRDGAGQAEHL